MTLRTSSKRATPRWLTLIGAVVGISALTGSVVLATLATGTLNAADGNLIVDGSEKDWANVGGVQIGIDKPTGQQDDSFGNGTKEDSPVPSVIDGSIPNNKSDLTRFLVASEKVGGKDYLYLAWERVQEPSGTTNMDFEFNKSDVISANGVTPVRSAGDLLIKYDLAQGGTNPILGYHRWVTTGAGSQCEANNAVPCWDKVHALTGNFEGKINTVAVVDPLGLNAPRTLSVRTFGEAAINLTDSNIFPAGSCSSFGSGYLKSRSSDSFTAAVKDFVAPIPVEISNCGSITIKKVTQNAPAGDATTFSYTSTGGLSPSGFSLAGGAQRDYAAVPAGSYSVTEGAQSSPWNFVSVSCTQSGTGTSTSTSGQTATITLAAEGDVECTFTNHYTNSPTLNTQVKNNVGDGNIANGASVAIGTVAYDTASLTGASSPTGNIQFYVEKGDPSCSVAGATSLGSKAIGTKSDTTTFATAGTYYFWAVYAGDDNNNGATSACNSELVLVSLNTSGISTAQDMLPNDSATITGVTATAGGTVSFKLFAPTDATCSGTAAYSQSVNVSGPGTYNTTNSTFHATTEGTWRWLVVYSGDANNTGSTSACGVERFTIANT